MHFLNYYSENIVKYDLINKFRYKTIKKIPKLTFAVLRFKLKHSEVKQLITALAALELITSQKGTLLKSRVPSIVLKIRKGQPIGCKVTLRRSKMLSFLTDLYDKKPINRMAPRTSTSLIDHAFSFKIKNVLVFNQLEKNYQFFKYLSGVDVSFITTAQCQQDLDFLLKAYKLKL